ncbi:MAG: DNA polymerase IV [Candidatus Bathyarchaeia archaeon]
MAQRLIIHVDLDYFYAQCEENVNPSIRGKPVIVCVYSGRTSESGVVSTSNYEARKYGVRAGTAIATAKRLLASTDAIFLPMNRALYDSVSGRIMNILRNYGDVFEQTGIDEAYLDVSESSMGEYATAKRIGSNIKEIILHQEQITCSIGIAPNKLLAKLASDHTKPNGLTVVEPEQVHRFLNGLEISRILGVGRKVEEKLHTANVKTIDDLSRLSPITLQEMFGRKLGTYLFLAAHGEDNQPVQDKELPTQMSRIGTLKENTRDYNVIRPVLSELTRSLTEKIQDERINCKSVSIIAILNNLTIHTRSRTLESSVKDLLTIDECAQQLLREFIESTPDAVLRRIGVKVTGLSKSSGQTNIDSFFSTEL